MKSFIIRAGFFCLGRGLQSASRFHTQLRNELTAWNEGFTIVMKVGENGPALALRKQGGRLRYLGGKIIPADLTVIMKTLNTGFEMITAQKGVARAYTEHKIAIEGNAADSMILTRCLTIIESYLFPFFLSKNILKKVPRFTLKDHLIRLRIYFISIPFGL